MSLRRRRIFRGGLAARGRTAGRFVLAGAACVLGLGGIVALGSVLPSFVAGLASPLRPGGPGATAVLRAPPRDVAVVSGDTLRVGDQVVRLQGIEAPSRGEACRAAADCGAASAASLAGLVGGRALECRLVGQDRMGRPYGDCAADGADLGRAQVAAGWARVQAGTGALPSAQDAARARRVGVWAGG